jgi:LuxR family transcriptional regulator, maltose regulon positive regulatory protein
VIIPKQLPVIEVFVSEPLLSTKLYRPQVRPGIVTRPRLITQLNTGLARKLTLLSAPAGFGKTTLLAEWIHSKEESSGQQEETSAFYLLPSAFAWLSLDEQDNDLTRFLLYLTAALQNADPAIGQAVLPRLQSSQTVPAETILTLLINDLSRLDSKVGLILDDYHLISNPAVHTALAFLLDHAPPQLHLVIAGRSDPPLSLARWHVRGEINEIRAADLRFTADETTQFLQQAVAQPLPPAATELLAARTEGWAAGLQLAALSLRGLDLAAAVDFIQSFGGTNRHVFAYLVEEVWQRQTANVQQFLLQTTLLSRLTAPLCEAIIRPGRPAAAGYSQAILDYLVSNNLFLIPLDENEQWFRYHPLFAEAIQARLQVTDPDLIPELHRRAGRWYATNSYHEQAIHHALAAHDYNTAAGLIDTAVNQLWPKGHLELPLSWLSALPAETRQASLSLELLYAWLLLLHDRRTGAEEQIARAGRQLAMLSPDDPDAAQYRGRWAAIQGAMAATHLETAAAITWMESALAQLPVDDIHWRQVAMMGLGLAQLAAGQAGPANVTLNQVALTCEQYDDLYLAFTAWWRQMEACWAQGQLHAAANCLDHLERLAERDEGNWLALPANAAIGRAMLAYERNKLAEARRLLATALPQVWPGGQPRVALQAYLTLARLDQAEGQRSQMEAHLAQADELVQRFNLTAEQMMVTAVTARLLLAEGELLEARWQLENRGIGPQSPPDFHHEAVLLSLVRLCLAQRQPDEALAILTRLQTTAEQDDRHGSLLEIALLQALALAQKQRFELALAHLNRALALAEPEKYGRIFINEGRPLRHLLAQISSPTPYAASLLAQMDTRPAAAPDALTARELEILRLVAAGASNQAIADQLVISLGTVKGHLNHILSKLEVQNRTAAVARARKLGLVP